MKCETDLSLIITIVKKGWGDEVLCASMDAGAEGGTILFGRGVGVHEYKKLFNIMIEPEKEVVLTVVSNSEADRVLESIVEAGKLEESGKGIVFLISIDKLLGRAHRAVEADPRRSRRALSRRNRLKRSRWWEKCHRRSLSPRLKRRGGLRPDGARAHSDGPTRGPGLTRHPSPPRGSSPP